MDVINEDCANHVMSFLDELDVHFILSQTSLFWKRIVSSRRFNALATCTTKIGIARYLKRVFYAQCGLQAHRAHRKYVPNAVTPQYNWFSRNHPRTNSDGDDYNEGDDIQNHYQPDGWRCSLYVRHHVPTRSGTFDMSLTKGICWLAFGIQHCVRNNLEPRVLRVTVNDEFMNSIITTFCYRCHCDDLQGLLWYMAVDCMYMLSALPKHVKAWDGHTGDPVRVVQIRNASSAHNAGYASVSPSSCSLYRVPRPWQSNVSRQGRNLTANSTNSVHVLDALQWHAVSRVPLQVRVQSTHANTRITTVSVLSHDVADVHLWQAWQSLSHDGKQLADREVMQYMPASCGRDCVNDEHVWHATILH